MVEKRYALKHKSERKRRYAFAERCARLPVSQICVLLPGLLGHGRLLLSQNCRSRSIRRRFCSRKRQLLLSKSCRLFVYPPMTEQLFQIERIKRAIQATQATDKRKRYLRFMAYIRTGAWSPGTQGRAKRPHHRMDTFSVLPKSP